MRRFVVRTVVIADDTLFELENVHCELLCGWTCMARRAQKMRRWLERTRSLQPHVAVFCISSVDAPRDTQTQCPHTQGNRITGFVGAQ